MGTSSDKIQKIANFVVAYLECGIPLRHVIRTTFDTIDGLKNGFVGPRGGVWNFNTSDLNDPKRANSILLTFPFISDSARKRLTKIAQGVELTVNVKLQCDHVVPRRKLEDMLHEQHRDTPMSGSDILDFHENYYRRCILTDSEHNQLRNDTMPTGWTPQMRLFARYDEARFGWAQNWK